MSKIEFSVIVKLILSEDTIDLKLGIALVNNSKFSTIDRFFVFKRVISIHPNYPIKFNSGYVISH